MITGIDTRNRKENKMSKIVKVKAIQNFTDSKEEVYRVAGDEFECTEERANQLVNFINGEKPYPLVEVLEAGAADNKDEEEAEEETIKESEVSSIELVDEVPEGEEVKESITIVPDEEESKEDKEEAEPKAKGNKKNTKANKAE